MSPFGADDAYIVKERRVTRHEGDRWHAHVQAACDVREEDSISHGEVLGTLSASPRRNALVLLRRLLGFAEFCADLDQRLGLHEPLRQHLAICAQQRLLEPNCPAMLKGRQ